MTPTAPDAPHSERPVEALAARTEQMLEAHVPLTLLLDLAGPTAPESASFYSAEGGDAGWAVR